MTNVLLRNFDVVNFHGNLSRYSKIENNQAVSLGLISTNQLQSNTSFKFIKYHNTVNFCGISNKENPKIIKNIIKDKIFNNLTEKIEKSFINKDKFFNKTKFEEDIFDKKWSKWDSNWDSTFNKKNPFENPDNFTKEKSAGQGYAGSSSSNSSRRPGSSESSSAGRTSTGQSSSAQSIPNQNRPPNGWENKFNKIATAKDAYAIFCEFGQSISPTSTPKEIKSAFKRIAIKTHPDKEGGNEWDFRLVSRAYHILCP